MVKLFRDYNICRCPMDCERQKIVCVAGNETFNSLAVKMLNDLATKQEELAKQVEFIMSQQEQVSSNAFKQTLKGLYNNQKKR